MEYSGLGYSFKNAALGSYLHSGIRILTALSQATILARHS
jgi:hypothetical protein